MLLADTGYLLPGRTTLARHTLACLSILLVFQTSSHDLLEHAGSAETGKPSFRIPANTEIDWEVDQLSHVRVLLPDDAILEQYTESQIKALVDHLEDPQKYISAHVILSQLNGDRSHTVPCNDGYDIWFSGLKVQLRYIANGIYDRKTVDYPETLSEKGITSQKIIANRWKDRLNKFGSLWISPQQNEPQDISIPFQTWCDHSSFDLKGVSNDRVKWKYHTFGIARPVLQRVHRSEIARGNTKYVPHLMTLLNDESRCVAAHIALCCIFEITESYHHVHSGNRYDLYLNGLHVVCENSAYTYPHLARQQAWLKYRWETSLPWLMQQEANRGH